MYCRWAHVQYVYSSTSSVAQHYTCLSHNVSVGNRCLFLSAHMYQAQTDKVDVNVPNSDGVTSVMLAVRDIDLFEGMTRLPWEYRPVEVLRELMRLSA